jgi:hypothetical protein
MWQRHALREAAQEASRSKQEEEETCSRPAWHRRRHGAAASVSPLWAQGVAAFRRQFRDKAYSGALSASATNTTKTTTTTTTTAAVMTIGVFCH